jgi:predicted RNA binding protein YcfA (HicA-like mRNA interferase family)
MTKLPMIKGGDLVRAFERAGFRIVRIKGSHHILEHPDGRRAVVPVHAGKDIKRGLLRKIIADAHMTDDEFLALL